MNRLQAILNDEIGRRTEIARSGTKMTETRSDAYGYNDRSELTNAVKNATLNEYAYQYDDIGNRETAFERGTNFTYEANNLNQYTTVGRGLRAAPLDDVFSPTYDLDGNQTLVQTKTGIWSVTYNGENRPVLWECGSTNIVMKFDRMGRRVEYIESVGSVTNKHQKFVYDGYLCIQRLNGANNSITELFEWDPTEKVATRPMFMQYRVPGQTYALFYTHDGNKNVSEVVHYSRANGVAAHYEYAPFGEVTAQVRQGGITTYDFAALNPWRFSSEYSDDASTTVYYNYRHYEPVMGRWMSRDPIEEEGGVNCYILCQNNIVIYFDVYGWYGSNLPGVLQWGYCEKAYNYALEHLHTPQERAAWERYTNHGWRGADRNIHLSAEDVQHIAMSINAVSEYIKSKRESCKNGSKFEASTSIGGNAPSPWVLAIGGVTINIKASCDDGCFSYCLSINDLYDFDIKGIPGFTSRSAKGEIVTWLVNMTETCLQCDWATFYHVGSFCGKD